MAAIGNLNDYVKLRLAEGLAKGEGGGAGGMAAQFAVGMSVAQQMMQQMGTASPPGPGATAPAASVPPPPPAQPSAAPPSGWPDLFGPVEAARLLGVSENDVLSALGDGSLKGKKIGAAWRITRAALDEFLKS
jgi:excisionase family DNA binding protein